MEMKPRPSSVYRLWSRADLTPSRLAKWDWRNDLHDEGNLSTQLALAYELRREHAARVWQAVQAVLAVACAWELQDGVVRGKFGALARGFKLAGWDK